MQELNDDFLSDYAFNFGIEPGEMGECDYGIEPGEMGEWEVRFSYELFYVGTMGYSEGNGDHKEQAIRGAEENLPAELGEPLEIEAKLTGTFPWQT